MRARDVVVVFALVGLATSGCKKTVEGETAKWTRNLQHVQELTVLYPGFAPALSQQKKQAEDAMEAARATSDQDTPGKMAAANRSLGGGFVDDLGELDGKMKKLREHALTASLEAEHGGDAPAARAAGDEAQRTLRSVEEQLRGGAATPAAATVILRKIDGDLDAAMAGLDRVIDAANQRKQAAAKATRDGGASAVAAPGPAPAAKVTWKCGFCGHVNDDSARKCPNCGAPRPAK